jgi:drug/metabolite transporter (DMT)-like permease
LQGKRRLLAPYVYMLVGCFFTAWMSQFAHLLKGACDWRVTALARTALAFVFAIGLARLSGARLVLWRPATLWLRSFSSSASLLCMFFALTRIPTSEVLTLTNTFPIWVAFLSWPLLHVRPGPAVWLAAGCGVAGVALIQSPQFEAGPEASLAVALSLVAALTSAIAMLGLHRLKGVHPWAIVAHYSGVATVLVLASWTVGETPQLPSPEVSTLLLLLGVGVAATLGQVFVTLAFTSGDPARVSVVGLMQIVFALGLDFLFAGPVLHPVALAGIALVLAPTAWMMADKAAKQSPANLPGPKHLGNNPPASANGRGEKSGSSLPDPHGVGRTS